MKKYRNKTEKEIDSLITWGVTIRIRISQLIKKLKRKKT